ncbi:MAG: branched-chain amino acid ABC transporter permease [Acidimicrobiia bacterium]|nr:branched-chain amino acid ABC transporter permease [Acidimicrobiia bacterium]
MDYSQVLTDSLRAAIGVPAIVYALAAIGLNVQFGYTGLLNFGHVGFLLMGAYGTAISVAEWGLPLLVAFFVGLASAALLALLLGLPTLRLRAEYLAIVTISAAEILRIVVRSGTFESFTGGPQGVGGFADAFFDLNPIADGSYGIGAVEFSERQLWVMVVGWVLVGLMVLVTRQLVDSPWGRVLRAIREDEDAVRSLGKNVFAYKLQSLVVGGVIGGLAGIVLSVDANFVDPAFWRPIVTFFVYTALILGGVGRVVGPVAGAMLFWFVLQAFDTLLRQAVTPDSWAGGFIAQSDLGLVRFALVGFALVLLVVFRPQGMFGRKEEASIDVR